MQIRDNIYRNLGKVIIFFVLSVGGLVPCIEVYAQNLTPGQAWVARYSGTTDGQNNTIRKSVTDALGNVYVTGQSTNTFGNLDYTTIKYDTNGNQVWVARYDNGDYDHATSITLDTLGNVYVTGTSVNTLGNSDFVTIKYDTNGNQLWVARYASNSALAYSQILSIDALNNVYITGSVHNGLNFDTVTIKYDTNGNQLWIARYDNGSNDLAVSILSEASGGVYVAVQSTNASGKVEFTTIKYDTSGNQLWVTRHNSISFGDYAVAILADMSGHVYLVGTSVDFSNNHDYLVVQYDSTSGSQRWAARYDNGFDDNAMDATIDTSGNLYITGQSMNSSGTLDYAVVKYGTDGSKLWAARYDNGGDDVAYSVSLDLLGNVYVAGQSNSPLGNFDFTTILYDSTSGSQRWVARYDNGADDFAYSVSVGAPGNIYVTGDSYDSTGLVSYMIVKYSFGSTDILINFWAQIKNSPQGWLNLRKTPGSTGKLVDDIIKTIPSDWVVKVLKTTDVNGVNVDLDGYRWYQVLDSTDGTAGWMAGKSLVDNIEYLPYEPTLQTSLKQKITSSLYVTKESRIPVILQAVNNYYIAPETNSLYGAGGGFDGLNNFQRFIHGAAYPQELTLAIIGHESMGTLNNEICSIKQDGGIGVMQITSTGFKGLGSSLKNYPKMNDCRGGVPTSLYYSNAFQGIFANIKDGFRTLQEKYRKKCPDAQLTVGGLSYTCQDVERVLMTWAYNGKVLTGDYLKFISNALADLSSYFPGVSYANSDQLIEKLLVANANRIEFKKFSPVEIQAIDNQGRVTGVDVASVMREEIPFSRYDQEADGGVIFFPQGTYAYRVIGTGTGTYGFKVEFTQDDILHTFYAKNIPVFPGEVHEYVIDWEALDRGERGVLIRVDKNGDGIFDYTTNGGKDVSDIELPKVSIISPIARSEYLLNSSVVTSYSATDLISGIATTSATLNGVAVSSGDIVTFVKSGVNTLVVMAVDNAGNKNTATSTFMISYDIGGGFLAPLNSDKIEKEQQKRIIPVKFNLRDAIGRSVANAVANIYVAKIVNGVVGVDENPVLVPGHEKDGIINRFRYDKEEKIYLFNLSTKTMLPGFWQIKAVLDSGQEITTAILIK